ncbi:MAG: hypothetical protein RIR33_1205 [Pseudomonadota bacterium]|jgi:hypothetical protein
MTETLGQPDFGSRLMLGLQQAFGVLAKAGFGLFLLFAAIAALIATTFIGLMLAIAAVFLTIGRPRRRVADQQGAPQTLDARRTADGWVIEL